MKLMIYVVFCFLVSSCSNDTRNTLSSTYEVENNDEDVIRLEITICKNKMINNGVFVKLYLEYPNICGDTEFTIIVDYANGDKINKKAGYSTSGLRFSHSFILENRNITLKETIAK